jgi:hypothetical protein
MSVRGRTAQLILNPVIVFVVAGFGALYGALSNMAVSWDGSYYLFNTLESQQPFEPHLRFVNAITQAPTLIAQRFTDQLPLLRLMYGMTYMAVPLLALIASWVVLRRGHRHMFVWPVLAVLVATLPGQVNATCEALQSAQLVWPALLAAIVGVERGDRLAWFVIAISGLFAAVAHPYGVVLMAGVLVVCLLGRRKREAMLTAVLLVSAVANAWWSFDPYESHQITTGVIHTGFMNAVWGGPMVAIGSSAIGAALIALGDRSRHRTLLAATGVACQFLALASLVPWAASPTLWDGALDFRIFTPVVIVPMAIVALFDGRRSAPADLNWRQIAAVTAAAGFAAIMVVQGLSVQRLDAALTDAIDSGTSGCVTQADIQGSQGTVLDAWSTPARSILFGSRTPIAVVLPGNQCAALDGSRVLPLAAGDGRPIDTPGWFDLTRLVRNP